MTLTPGVTAVEQVSKEQLQEIIDGCEGVTPGPWFVHEYAGSGSSPYRMVWDTDRRSMCMESVPNHTAAHIARLDPSTVKAMATLALQSLDREGVSRAQQAYDILVSGEPPFSEWECKASYALSQTPGLRLSALSPQPETAKEVRETEAVLDGPELWEIVFGVFKGDVPEELTDEKLSQIAAAVQRVFIHPAPQSPPAPVVDEGMVERAAIGIYNEGPSIGQDCECGWKDQTPQYKQRARMVARAALKAALEGRS